MLALANFKDILSTRTSGGNQWRDGVRNHAANSRVESIAGLFSPAGFFARFRAMSKGERQ